MLLSKNGTDAGAISHSLSLAEGDAFGVGDDEVDEGTQV